MSSVTPAKPRLASLDQFRGYTVAGMFLVNFLAAYHGWVPPILHHHHTYCSYADTIMPHFLFAVGFAMRLSFGRHVQTEGLIGGYWRMVRRIIGLFLVSFAIYTEGHVAQTWHQLTEMGAWNVIFPFLKREWMQTLGHIALTGLWILPVIRAGAGVRIAYMIASGAAHVALSHWFAYHWTNSDPNGIDGGPLGFLTWSVPAILGTLTCDAIVGAKGRPPLIRLVFVSLLVMGLGWLFSCGTRFYDLSPTQRVELKQKRKVQDEEKHKIDQQIEERKKKITAHNERTGKLKGQLAEAKRVRLKAKLDELMAKPENAGRARGDLIDDAERQLPAISEQDPSTKLTAELNALEQAAPEIEKLGGEIRELEAQKRKFLDVKLAPSPVIPPRETWEGRTWQTLIAEPPFVPPPQDDPRVDPPPYDLHRYWNYWMMTQRGGALSYTTFAGGLSILVYVLFYVMSDMLGIRIGLFRTFGSNALAAYWLASVIGGAVKTFIPNDAPAWYVVAGFSLDMFLIWLFVRTLEKNNIYLRV